MTVIIDDTKSSAPVAGTAIGWIGTGVMGASMCGHLIAAGCHTKVFNRTREKTAPLVAAGATAVARAADAVQGSRFVFTMLGFPRDVSAVYLGPRGLIELAEPGTVLVDLTSSEPTLAREIAAAGKERGLSVLDAPVSGGDVGARAASLAIMCGGDPATFRAALPYLNVIGKNITHQGAAGAGQHTKLCNQIVITGTMIGVCEALLYGRAAGLDLETVLAGIARGAAGCWTLDNLAPRILRRDFQPGFFVEHFVKDMGIMLKEAEALKISLPGVALVRELYKSVMALGGARLGTQSLLLALEHMAGEPGRW